MGQTTAERVKAWRERQLADPEKAAAYRSKRAAQAKARNGGDSKPVSPKPKANGTPKAETAEPVSPSANMPYASPIVLNVLLKALKADRLRDARKWIGDQQEDVIRELEAFDAAWIQLYREQASLQKFRDQLSADELALQDNGRDTITRQQLAEALGEGHWANADFLLFRAKD